MGAARRHIWERGETDIGFWREHLRNRDHLKYLGVGGGIILECKGIRWRRTTGLIWFRIGTSGWLLCRHY
jgi:hypothetical protein